MKIITFLGCIIISTQLAKSEIVSEGDAWRILSANSQNIHDKMRSNLNVGVDPSLYQKEVKQIEKSFEFLEEKKALFSKTIKVDSKKLEEFFNQNQFFNRLMKDYGVFVASEMLDCGKIYRDRNLLEKGELQLKVFLPREYFDELLTRQHPTKSPPIKNNKTPRAKK